MEKYKILWLDDEFADENGSDNLPLPLIRGRYPQLEIVTMQYVDWCEAELRSNSESYQAVILDANGKFSNEPTLEANKVGFEDNISIAQEKGLPVYVFSGQLEIKEVGDQADITKRNLKRAGFIENVNLFFKSGTYKLLLDKVLSDLKNNFSVFYEYPIVLENVLRYGVNKDTAKDMLLWIKDNSLPFPEYAALRKIVVDEIINNRLKQFFQIGDGKMNDDKITENCMMGWEKTIILSCLRQLLNAEIHGSSSNSIHSNNMIAHAFIVTMEWFNRFMHSVEKNPNPHDYYILAPDLGGQSTQDKTSHVDITSVKVNKDRGPVEGVIEIDKDGFYVVGPYILNPNWAKRNLGKYVRVTKTFNFKYPKSAMCEEIKETASSDLSDK